MKSRIPLLIFLAASAFFVIPLFFMVLGSIVPSYTSRAFTFAYLNQALTSPRLGSLLINTLEYGLGGASLELVLAVTYAWLVTRTDVPGKRILRLMPVLPLTIPLIVKGFAWIFLFSPNVGLANLSLEHTFGLSQAPFNIYSMTGMIFAWGIGGLPFGYLVMEAGLNAMDPSLEESSLMSGAGTLRTFFKVTLPLLRPAIVAAFLLGFIGGVENFDYPFILGSRGGISTLATQVYQLVSIGETSLAAAYGIIFLMLTLTLITIYLIVTRNSFRFVVVTGKATRATIFRLGRWKWAGLLVCATIFIFAFVLPMSMIVLLSLIKFYTVGGANPFTNFTLDAYYAAFKIPLLQSSIINSFEVAISAGLLSTFLSTFVAYAILKSKSRFGKLIEYVGNVPLAFPGVVYSTALIWTFLTIPIFNSYLYGTIIVMLVALTTLWLPYSLRIMSSALIQISDELEEAASVSGASFMRRLTGITAPLLKTGLVNSFTYVMVNTFRELGGVILLYNSGSILMIILITNLYEQGGATKLAEVAALSVIMTLMLATVTILMRLLSRPRSKA